MPRDPTEIQREDRIRLMHMLEAARRVARYCDGMTQATLEVDEMRFLAVVKSIEVVGEAAMRVSEATQARVVGIDWRGIRRMRNRMIHGYDTIDPARVWDAVELDIPGLITALQAALESGSAACLCCECRMPPDRPRVCPICRHEFRGSGWDGIDAHWRAHHEDVMPYEQFWDTLCQEHRG